MALDSIRADFRCDGCGKPFSVLIDPPYQAPAGWSCFDIAVDAVRGSVGYFGPETPEGFGGVSSVEDDRHLCGWCTSKADSQPDDDCCGHGGENGQCTPVVTCPDCDGDGTDCGGPHQAMCLVCQRCDGDGVVPADSIQNDV